MKRKTIPIEMHQAPPTGVTSLMYVGDSGDGLGLEESIEKPSLGPWMLLGGALFVLGMWLGRRS